MSAGPRAPASIGALLGLGGLVAAGAGALVGGPPFALIALSACALCFTIFLMWSSLDKMGQGKSLDFEDALELAAPTATEEQKLAVLRALKDLEYELSVGKISREDFDQASSEYRKVARELIAAQDASMKELMVAAEARVQAHLVRAESTPASTKKKKKKAGSGARSESVSEAGPAESDGP